MSRLNIRVGAAALDLADSLGAVPDQVEVAKKRALTLVASAIRRKLVAEIVSATQLPEAAVKARVAVYNMNSRYQSTRVVPSSAAIPASDYAFAVQRTRSSWTRARYSVPWVGGRKIGAGFVNPLGQKGAPLSTRSARGKYTYKYGKPKHAMGPSAAAAAKQIITEQFVSDAQQRLMNTFEDQLIKRILKDDESL